RRRPDPRDRGLARRRAGGAARRDGAARRGAGARGGRSPRSGIQETGVGEGEKSTFQRALSRGLEPSLYWLDNVGNIVTLTGRTLVWLFRPPFRMAQMMAMMDFIGVQSIFIVALTGTFSGMVLALQTTYALRAFSAEGRVGGLVAVSLTRELAPVFSSIMVTARAGSAMAA